MAQLAADGVDGTARLVEQLHLTVAGAALPLGRAVEGRTQGITGLVYRTVGGVNAVVRGSIDTIARPLIAGLPRPGTSPAREHWRAALNGVLGDHLAVSDNPLAIDMAFRRGGEPLVLTPEALTAAFERPGRRLLVAVHGLCMNDLHWGPSNLPDRLGRRLGLTPVYLHYNSGRPIAENGMAFAGLLEALVSSWPEPVDEIVIMGHSMGGLLARSARAHAEQAGQQWPRLLRRMVFLGTPHHGSPVERAGHGIDSLLGVSPYSAPFTRLGAIRSAGITDLRGGMPTVGPSSLSLAGIDCFAFAATAQSRAGRLAGGTLGDGLVPVDSALGRHSDPELALGIPEQNCRVIEEAGHVGLIHHPDVLRELGRWLR